MTHKILNLTATFTLILAVFTPNLVIAAGDSYNSANSGPNYTSTISNTISEDPGAKLLKIQPKPDAVYKGVVSAYTSTPDQTDSTPFYGAIGTHVYFGMIAVNGLPIHTKIKIPSVYGDKIFEVEDRMNKRYTCTPNHCHADVWLDMSRSEAMKFGVKKVDIEIYFPSAQLALNK